MLRNPPGPFVHISLNPQDPKHHYDPRISLESLGLKRWTPSVLNFYSCAKILVLHAICYLILCAFFFVFCFFCKDLALVCAFFANIYFVSFSRSKFCPFPSPQILPQNSKSDDRNTVEECEVLNHIIYG